VQSFQASLNPAAPPEHRARLHLDPEEQVAGVSGEVRELVDEVDHGVTAHLVQRREQNGSFVSSTIRRRHQHPAAIVFSLATNPRRQPAQAPRLNGPLVERHFKKLQRKHSHGEPKVCPKRATLKSNTDAAERVYCLRARTVLTSRHIRSQRKDARW